MANEKTEPKQDEKPSDKKAGHVIAEGCSLTSQRGILDAGTEVKEADVGPESFEACIKSGHIVKA